MKMNVIKKRDRNMNKDYCKKSNLFDYKMRKHILAFSRLKN